MISKLIEYFYNLGVIDNKDNILLDYLGEEPTEYVIEPIPTTSIVRSYADGGNLKQFVFQFGSREFYNSNVVQELKNSQFYEDFSKLIETNNNKRVLPEINGIQSIECLSNGTINEANTDNAKYVIQMRITYVE